MKRRKSAEIKDDKRVICPTCGLPHGLFYIRSADDKRTLNYTCNKAQHQVWKDGYKILKRFTQCREVEFVDGLEVEERWTKQYAKLVDARRYRRVAA